MNRPLTPAPRRRLAFALLVVAGMALGFGAGCVKDDTVRGAGSIDVPPENLKFQPKVKGAKPPKAAQHP